VTVDELEKHYERAEVDAESTDDGQAVKVKTANVSRLILERGQRVALDGQDFTVGAGANTFEKRGGKWALAAGTDSRLRKKHGLQGPIDDVTMDSFLCVRPTGKPLQPLPNDFAQASLERFSKEFAKWLRGDVIVKDDRAVTKLDIASHNLIVFGDPGSNSILAQVAGKLPIQWTKNNIRVGQQSFSSEDHVPVMIYPNPLNPQRYIVINGGYTFHEADLQGTNALQYPRLGDYAVLKLARPASGAPIGEVAAAGIFGEFWELVGNAGSQGRGR
jgi:hypothetical protein